LAAVCRKFASSALKRRLTRLCAPSTPKERINDAAFDTFRKYAGLAKRGGKILTGGGVRSDGVLKHGYYVEPTIVDRLPATHSIHREELFVPILSVLPYKTLDEAIGIDAAEAYEAALVKLSNEQREAVMMRIELGFSYQQIAEAQDRPSANAARMVVARALVRLAELMRGIRGTR